MTADMDAIDRMYEQLVKVIKERFPQYRSHPFTVAELYQTILPYRLNRRELALETVQEYEAALLTLLAGGKGYLVVDDRMRDAIRSEMQTNGPSTELIRRFGAEHLALAPEPAGRLSRSGGALEVLPGAPDDSPPPQSSQSASARRGLRSVATHGEPCRYCGGALPAGRRISFCPHCGQNVTTINCDACGTELEVGWLFCTTCGREVRTEEAENRR
jgi:hypothetical protein